MAQKEGINTPLVITIGIISSILLVVIAFTVEGWFQYQEHEELAAKWQTMSDQTAAQPAPASQSPQQSAAPFPAPLPSGTFTR